MSGIAAELTLAASRHLAAAGHLDTAEELLRARQGSGTAAGSGKDGLDFLMAHVSLRVAQVGKSRAF